jgi:hypothetical protein
MIHPDLLQQSIARLLWSEIPPILQTDTQLLSCDWTQLWPLERRQHLMFLLMTFAGATSASLHPLYCLSSGSRGLHCATCEHPLLGERWPTRTQKTSRDSQSASSSEESHPASGQKVDRACLLKRRGRWEWGPLWPQVKSKGSQWCWGAWKWKVNQALSGLLAGRWYHQGLSHLWFLRGRSFILI